MLAALSRPDGLEMSAGSSDPNDGTTSGGKRGSEVRAFAGSVHHKGRKLSKCSGLCTRPELSICVWGKTMYIYSRTFDNAPGVPCMPIKCKTTKNAQAALLS